MEEIWERAVKTALVGETEPLAARILTLDGAVKCFQGHLPRPEILERFQNLEHLSIASIGVSSLDQFPRLGKLQKLVLSDNRIAGGLEFLVQAGLDLLRDLDLSNNRIHLIEDLVPLAQLKLVSLDLYECPVTRMKDYRSRVFGLVKSLKYLDKMDAEENERPESEDEDDDEEEDEDGDEDDPESCEIDGEERPNVMSNGDSKRLEGVVEVDEEESEADEEETETGRQSNGVSDHANGLPDEHKNVDEEEIDDSDEDGKDENDDDGFLVGYSHDEEDVGESDEEVDNDEGHLRVPLDGHEEVAEEGREPNWMIDFVANGSQNVFLNVDDEDDSDEEEGRDEYDDDGFLVDYSWDNDEEDVGDGEEEVDLGVPHRKELLRNIIIGEIDGDELDEEYIGESREEEEEEGVKDDEEEDEEYEAEHLAQPVMEAIEVDEEVEGEEEYEDDEVQVFYSIASSNNLKRKRDEDDDGDSGSSSSDNNDDDGSSDDDK
ncbi:acidic leucine-rich nuclear phosphoprotein 32-related protein [Eutrema salsugineum]|uniref:acidic leucine-rich nuclear phosphoprotein 32-related protein n=1 Tax=Eutrema salsugineum TaxID=72664 RepID=UPI000CED6AC9|nr:acidic leucine-rich nuclear phosphoprotein 32-related protein [Eutrema salsugineum]